MRQLLILFLFVSLSFAQITTVVSNRGGSGGGGGGGGCDSSETIKNLDVSTTLDDYYDPSSDPLFTYQKCKLSSEITICQISVVMWSSGGTGTLHLEILNASDSTQIGGDSSTETLTPTADPGDWIDFTWSTNKPNPSADFFICFVEESGTTYFRVQSRTTAYEDTDYDVWRGGYDRNRDLIFCVFEE